MSEQNEQGTTAAGGDALVEQDHAAKAAEAAPPATSATPAAIGAVPVAVEKYRPAVVADADGIAGANGLLAEGLEEDLRPLGFVNPVVGGGAEIRLLHPRGLAAEIRHTRRPDLLSLHGGQKGDVGERHTRGAGDANRRHRIRGVEQFCQ